MVVGVEGVEGAGVEVEVSNLGGEHLQVKGACKQVKKKLKL
jgi:hypothetical protein